MLLCRQALVAGLSALALGSASGAYIVDTGAPAPGAVSISLNNQGVAFQNLGLTFNVGADSSITSIEGWIKLLASPGDMLIELHSGSTPGGPVLFSALVSMAGGAADWRGLTGLDWDVTAGDYTVMFVAQPGLDGAMDVNPPNPAGTEWVSNPFGTFQSTFNLGWRVGADPARVPEPGAYSLALLALVAAGAARRRGRRNAA